MSIIQEELVREAILAVCFPLVEKQIKGEEDQGSYSPVRERPAENSASIHTEEKTISTRATHCNSLVSTKRDWPTLPKMVAILVCKTCLQYNELSNLSVYEKSSTSNTKNKKKKEEAYFISQMTCK